MDTIRVLIVDDHPMVRRGLRSLLSSYEDIHVVGEVGDSPSAVLAARTLSPDVVLLDILLPGVGGLELAGQLGREAPSTKVVMLTAFDNDEYVFGALRVGAYAYLLKSTSDDTVVETVRQVYQGRRLLSPDLMDKVLRQFQDLARSEALRDTNLSDQELRVLRLMAEGATNKELGEQTFWSERTIKRKVQEIMDKLGSRNRAQAVAEAIRRGLL